MKDDLVSHGKPDFWSRLGFALGTAGMGIGGAPLQLLLLFYLTQIQGLRPGLAGLVVGLPKVWDMLVDPALGGIVDRIAQRHGRRGPIMLVSIVVHVVALYLLFSLPQMESQWLMMCGAVLLLILASVTQTMFGVSHLALANDMTEDAGERTVLFAYSAVLAALLTLGSTAAAPFLVSWGGEGRIGYSRMAGVVTLLSILAFLIFVVATWHYRIAKSVHAAGEMPLSKAILATFANHPFYYLMGFLICFGTTNGLVGAFVPFINQYVLHAGAAGLSVLGSVVLVATLASMPVAALLARRFGNMAVLQAGNFLIVVAFPLLYVASFGPAWASWFVVGLFGFGAGGLALVLQSMVIDIAKIILPGGVIVSLGVYLGTLLAGQKLGQSIGGMLAGLVLDAIGFVPGAQEQSAEIVAILRIGYTFIPFLLSLAGTFFLWRVRIVTSSDQAGTPSEAVAE